MKIIFLFLFLIASLFANPEATQNQNEFTTSETPVFDMSAGVQVSDFVETNESNIVIENLENNQNNLIRENNETNSSKTINYYEELSYNEDRGFLSSQAKNIYLSYKDFPKSIFKNQRFEITISAIITSSNYDRIETRFLDSNNMEVLNLDSNWTEIEDQRFENTYFFKAFEDNFTLPTFQVAIYKDNDLIEFAKIAPEDFEFNEIGKNIKSYSSVIAKSFVINAHKTKQYNNDELITIIDIDGVESNLEDFYIKGVEEQGISKIEDNYPNQNLLYHLVLPVHTKKLEFTYYNSVQKRYIPIKLPIVLENELVSTQTDLNPNKSNLVFYKKIALGVAFLLFMVLYFWKRKGIYLFLSIVFLIVSIYNVTPNQTKILKKSSYIYILPTKKSTVFQQTTQNHVVEVSVKRDEFVKIILRQNGTELIGWVKESDFVKN